MSIEIENNLNASAENFSKKINNFKINDFSSNDNTISTNNTQNKLSSKNTLSSQKSNENCRYDAYGTKIIKKNKKKYKVTFIDQLNKNNELVEFFSIPNYKKLNSLMSFSEQDKVEAHGCCSCTIFVMKSEFY